MLYSFLKWWHSSVIANSCERQTISTNSSDLWSAFIMAKETSITGHTYQVIITRTVFFTKKEHLLKYFSIRLQLKPSLSLKRHLCKFMSAKIDCKTKISHSTAFLNLSKEKANWNISCYFQVIVTKRVNFFVSWLHHLSKRLY